MKTEVIISDLDNEIALVFDLILCSKREEVGEWECYGPYQFSITQRQAIGLSLEEAETLYRQLEEAVKEYKYRNMGVDYDTGT